MEFYKAKKTESGWKYTEALQEPFNNKEMHTGNGAFEKQRSRPEEADP